MACVFAMRPQRACHAPMMSAPFMANFMLPVPLASVPAVEMCWLHGRGRGGGNHAGEEPFRHAGMSQHGGSTLRRAPGIAFRVSANKPRLWRRVGTTHLSSVPGMMVSATDTL